MKQRTFRRKLFGFLLAFALVMGMIPGTSRVVYAEDGSGTSNNSQYLVTIYDTEIVSNGFIPIEKVFELIPSGQLEKEKNYEYCTSEIKTDYVAEIDDASGLNIIGTGRTAIIRWGFKKDFKGNEIKRLVYTIPIQVETGKSYDWSETDSLPSTEGRYVLKTDVTLNDSWNAPKGVTKLDLNGHTITINCNGSISVGSRVVLYISGDDSGTIKGGESSSWGVTVTTGGLFMLTGGTISGFNNGGVNVNGGSFVMTGGTIRDSLQGVLAQNNSDFEMEGGSILNNSHDGINIKEGANCYLGSGLISGNGVGARIYGDDYCNISDIEITNNKSGLLVFKDISLFGKPVIKDNKDDSKNDNLRLFSGATISANGLEDGAEVGINTVDYCGFFTNDLNAGEADTIVKYFKSDDETKEVKVSNITNQLYLTNDTVIAEGTCIGRGESYNGKCNVILNGKQYAFEAIVFGKYGDFAGYTGENEQADLNFYPIEGIGFKVTSIDEKGIPTIVYGFADTKSEVIEWTPSESDPLPSYSGYFKLMSDVAITGPWLVDGNIITLDLNGHKIVYTKSEVDVDDGWGAEVTDGAVLTLTGNGTFTNHVPFVEEPGMSTGIAVRNGGTLNIDGCIIENFTRGVLLTAFESDTVFGSCNLISGEVRNGDWGVVVDCGTFTMTGGEITKHGTYGVDNHDKAFIKGGKILNNELKAVNTEEGATTEISESATVVNKKPAPTLTDDQKPTAIEKFNYDGKAHALVVAPKAALPEGYTMLYALGKSDKDTDIPGTGWDTAIPKGTEAGTYYVWAWPVGDEEHTSVEVFCLIAAIVPPTVAEDKVDTPTLETTTEAGSSSPAVSIKLYTEEATKVSTAKPAVKSHELVTENGIGIRFYVDLSMLSEEQKAAVKVNFTGGATSQAVFNDAVKDSIGNYGFTCLVNSTQIGNDITASIYYGGSEPVVDTYKVTDYTEKFENKTASEIAGTGASAATVAKVEKVVNLVNAVSDFGNAMNAIKDASASNIGSTTAQTTIPETKVQQAAAALVDKTPEKTGSADIAKVTYTLTLGPKTSINFYVKALGQNVISSADVTVTKDSSPVTVTTGTDSKGRIKVTVSGIDAADLDDMYTITVTSGSNSFSMGVSALTYANYILNTYSGSQAAKQAAAALLLYNQAAEAMNN